MDWEGFEALWPDSVSYHAGACTHGSNFEHWPFVAHLPVALRVDALFPKLRLLSNIEGLFAFRFPPDQP